MKLSCLFVACVFVCLTPLQGELIFTSPIRTKSLFSTVDGIISTLEEYIAHEENHHRTVEGYLDQWRHEHDHNAADPDLYLSNHIDLYYFLKKLQLWWPYMHDRARENSAPGFLPTLKDNENYVWPTEEDMTGILDSIINIQQIYHQEAIEFADGKIKGISTNTSLFFDECFMMSERCFETTHYELALQWSITALKKYVDERVDDEERIAKVLYYISYSSFVTGDHNMAWESINAYLKKNPNDGKAKTLRDVIHFKLPPDHKESIKSELETFQKVKNLCLKSSTETELFRRSYLKCRYNFGNNFLKIAPIKEEVLSVIPTIILYRDVIYDSELTFLKKQLKNQLQEFTEEEESKQQFINTEMTWFNGHEYSQLSKLCQRVDDMTGLQNKSHERFQLFKYGLKGSFIDYGEGIEKNGKLGRHAKIIFQMNDVLQGGSTVFPSAGIAVKAERGTALVWFDEIRNQFDQHTTYASCAVAAGCKWILGKRILENSILPQKCP